MTFIQWRPCSFIHPSRSSPPFHPFLSALCPFLALCLLLQTDSPSLTINQWKSTLSSPVPPSLFQMNLIPSLHCNCCVWVYPVSLPHPYSRVLPERSSEPSHSLSTPPVPGWCVPLRTAPHTFQNCTLHTRSGFLQTSGLLEGKRATTLRVNMFHVWVREDR